jgi:hypothetical protein
MVSPEFAYSTRGALAALGVAAVSVSVLYAFTVWPVATAGWLVTAALLRFVGRHPIAELFR